MEEIVILDAAEVNWEDYKNLRLEALKEEPQAYRTLYQDEIKTPDLEWQRRLENYAEGKQNWMVFAKQGLKLVGMMGAFQSEKEIAEKSAIIIAVYVQRVARGKGVSKLLMERMLQKLQNAEIKKVKLMVSTDQVAAVKLYEGAGFTVVGKDTIQLGDGKNHEEYVMEKEL